ncbi:Folate-Biopterin Transporter (FBT) Family [Achlya hypogyna]|uniref:Folate-Biopterin Transporter (FBT) Family n=1 Tax=Achlya hypogyna TaxID=1202772 RepID=A0A1V9Z5D3_ACHHY|nr:Folate-Biopterin Transporter (FBT) Family [Achlya hypogyna]
MQNSTNSRAVSIVERVSFISSAVGKPMDEYDESKTPGELENGALRDGGPPDYFGRDVLGLLSQYFCVGLLYGCLPNILYPVFTGYYHLTGAQYNSAKSLVGIGWSFKAFVGMFSDCVPIFGYRRKSWMMIGWTCCLGFLLVLCCMDLGQPYYLDPSVSSVDPPKRTAAQNATINSAAVEKGGLVAIIFGLATISYIIADVPSDALVVEYAQREPIETRGRMQSLVYTTRTISSMISNAIAGFCMNSPRFAGNFSWDFGVHTMYIILCVPCAIMVPMTFFVIKDRKAPRIPLLTYCGQVWGLVKKRAMWQIMCFNFFYNLLGGNLSSTAATYVQLHWAKVENLNNQIMSIVSSLIFAAVIASIGRWGTHWNWRIVVATTTLSTACIDAIVQFCTFYDVLRDQWFYIGVPLAEQLPQGVLFIVTTFMIVELAEIGNEGIIYGMLTTVSNLPSSVGPIISNIIDSQFQVDEATIISDTRFARDQVAYTYAIYYAGFVAACFTVWLLPSQKAGLHELQRHGGEFPIIGGTVLLVAFGVLVFTIVASILSMSPNTACLADPTRAVGMHERVSFVSSTHDKNADYADAKTPVDLEDGALRAGGPPNYMSKEVLGLLSQYVAVGLFYGCLPNILYPVINGYFHMTGAQYNSAKALLGIGWSVKAFIGVLSDCVPLFGYRRKSWMIIGWTCCLVCMLVLATMDMGLPYYLEPRVRKIDPIDRLAKENATLNEAAKDKGGIVAILFGAATISYLFADVPADALVVEYAQREPSAIRGRMQSLVYTTRTVAAVAVNLICGFCMNSANYNGSFDWDFGNNTMYIILCIPCICMVPVTYFFVVDTKAPRVQFGSYCSQVWELLQKRAMWQIMLFNFFYNLLGGGNLASTAAPNVVRNQWFYLGVPLAEQLPQGVLFIVTTFMIVELAEVGNEGMVYGLLTTVSNLPGSLGPVIANVMYSGFDVKEEDIISDTPHVRNQVASTYLIFYSGYVIACCCVFFLPNQKAALHELQRTGGNYPIVGGCVVVFVFACLVLSITGSMLSMSSTTECLSANTQALGFEERVSYVSGPVDKAYDEAKTPTDLEDGALRGGGAPVYTSKEVLGLLSQYVAVGLMLGALPNMTYPLFTGYFHMSGAQYNSAKTLLFIGWSLKAFIGMLSDCVPIGGYRRKSWMILGWSGAFICLLVLACMDFGDPYYRDAAVGKKDASERSVAENATINYDAPTKGGIVALLFGLATISYVFADVPADALVVEYAQREPLAVRGRMQSLVYTTRTVSSTLSTAIAGFCMNSPRFAGDFDWDFGVNTMYMFLCVPCVAMVPVTYFFIVDVKMPRVPFAHYIAQIWQLLQKRAMWQIMLFNFFYNLLGGGLSSTAAPYVQLHWAHVENLNSQIIVILSNFVLATVIASIGKWGTNWNWRIVVVGTTLTTIAIDMVVQFCTFYDVIRSQWFYLGVPLAEQLPQGVLFIVTTFIIVELAEIGNEGMVYGMLTTVSNLPAAVGPVLSSIICSHFQVDEASIVSDTPYVRNQVTYTYLIYYAGFVAAAMTSIFLPSQKAALHELQRNGGSYPLVGGCVLVFVLAALCFSITASVLSMFPSTSCMVVAGGDGC